MNCCIKKRKVGDICAALTRRTLCGAGAEDFESVGSSQYKNFFLTSNQETGAVYGTIKLTLEDSNGTVTLGGKGGHLDTYDFEQKKSDGTIKRELRNIGTKAGALLAGDGTGYKIYNYGKGKVEKTKK